MAFKLTVLGSVRMRKAILESVTTEVGLLPTDGVLGSFGGLVPGSQLATADAVVATGAGRRCLCSLA